MEWGVGETLVRMTVASVVRVLAGRAERPPEPSRSLLGLTRSESDTGSSIIYYFYTKINSIDPPSPTTSLLLLPEHHGGIYRLDFLSALRQDHWGYCAF